MSMLRTVGQKTGQHQNENENETKEENFLQHQLVTTGKGHDLSGTHTSPN